MSDQFTEVATVGYGKRIVSSLKGVVAGLAMFILSFIILYSNEGKVDFSNIAKTAIEISSTKINTDPSINGKLISVTGDVKSDQMIGDDLYLNPDKFIAVERQVEMYAWKEKTQSHSETNTGGSKTTETTYTYLKDWERDPKSSNNFKHPEGHENPQKSLEDHTSTVAIATIGLYNFYPQNITLPNFSRLSLSSQNVTINDSAVLNGGYIFLRKNPEGSSSDPQVGDLRISYNILRPGFKGTVFGQLNGNKVDVYIDQNRNNFYRLFTGTREQGISTLHAEYTALLWIFRFVGFLLMWIGLSALFGPISVLLDFLPIFGTISRFVIGIITFSVAFILSIVTILISMIIHNPIALIVALVIVLGAIIIFFTVWKNKRKSSGNIVTETASIPVVPSINNQLESYVQAARINGMNNDQIRQQLLTSGWTNDVIDRFLS